MSNWWANKLGTTAQPQQPATAYVPSPTTQQYIQQIPQAPQVPNGLEGHRLPASATSADRCPNCASGNYGKSAAAPEAKARCYDCGYPITQSGSGSPGIKTPTNGAVVAARQLNTQNNFNPQTIVDRIG
jgi:hypothetical protein